jgi:hypothetical protein
MKNILLVILLFLSVLSFSQVIDSTQVDNETQLLLEMFTTKNDYIRYDENQEDKSKIDTLISNTIYVRDFQEEFQHDTLLKEKNIFTFFQKDNLLSIESSVNYKTIYLFLTFQHETGYETNTQGFCYKTYTNEKGDFIKFNYSVSKEGLKKLGGIEISKSDLSIVKLYY